jgi:hypothetical protein
LCPNVSAENCGLQPVLPTFPCDNIILRLPITRYLLPVSVMCLLTCDTVPHFRQNLKLFLKFFKRSHYMFRPI